MSEFTIFIQQEFNVAPEVMYNDWLSSEGHTNLTGGEALIKAEIGSHYSAWDGYIYGEIKQLEKGKQVVHSWRTSEFLDAHKDSILTVRFEPSANGTLFTLEHTDLVSSEAVKKYTDGWKAHYIEPMKALYNR